MGNFLLVFMFLVFIINGAFSADLKKATFAGGCFWCMEKPFEGHTGIKSVISGYAGGKEKNPTYKQVAWGKTTHKESVQVTYDPSKISYDDLLQIYWRSFNPTDGGGQFADRGDHYRPAIFFHNEEQKMTAEKSKKMDAGQSKDHR